MQSASDFPCTRIEALDLRRGEGHWEFEDSRRAEIAAHWRECCAREPSLFDGRVLLAHEWSLAGGVFTARFIDAGFSAFLAWRDWGYPDASVKNVFGSPLLISADGAVLFGRMGAHTANAGWVYPPCGSLEPEDVLPDGRVDVIGSAARELREETGLLMEEAEDRGRLLVFDGPRIAVAQLLRSQMDEAALAARIQAATARQARPELAEVLFFRRIEDARGCEMPPFARALLHEVLEGRAPAPCDGG
jgi:8-oxo-dGTP pyrophosphatase MutT (NUDIX family)